MRLTDIIKAKRTRIYECRAEMQQVEDEISEALACLRSTDVGVDRIERKRASARAYYHRQKALCEARTTVG